MRIILSVLLLFTLNSALANVTIDISRLSYFVERENVLSIEQVKSLQQAGAFEIAGQKNMSFGANSKPVWLLPGH